MSCYRMASPTGQSKKVQQICLAASEKKCESVWLKNRVKECLWLTALETFLNVLHKRWDFKEFPNHMFFIFTRENTSRLKTNSWIHSQGCFSAPKLRMHCSLCSTTASLIVNMKKKKKEGCLVFRPILDLRKPASLLCNHPLNSEGQQIFCTTVS